MKKNQKKLQKVGFIALGCPKNAVDSEKMLALIARSGFAISEDPFKADAVVINTCGFIEPAKLEAIEAIKEAVKHKKKGHIKKLIVAGCLTERLKEDLFNEVSGIDCLVGLGSRDRIASIIENVLDGRGASEYLDRPYDAIFDDSSRLLIGPSHRAYLRISEGCDRCCSFCTVPSIRGRFRSKPLDMIVSEAGELAKSGVVELIVIGQDTTRWGRDLNPDLSGQDGLPLLAKKLEELSGPRWIRLMYLYPKGITDRLIDVIRDSKKIVHYLDIPFQHINEDILRAMRRPDKQEHLYRLIEKLRDSMPDVILRTTMIVGFPSETEKQFDQIIDFVKWARFDALGCFKFYPESGTAAAKLPGQVPEKVKQERFDQLMLTQQHIAFEKNRQKLGSKLTCLVDAIRKDGAAEGRFYGQAPEIDSICIIKNSKAKPGQFIQTKVIGSKDYDLIVEQV